MQIQDLHLFVLNNFLTFVLLMTKNQNTENRLSLINKYAMHYGLLLGLFWIFRYMFLMIGGAGVSDRFIFLFYLLNIGTLLIIYMFYYKFKTEDPDKPKGAFECILFTVLMCFFASFWEGAMMYAHFEFIDPAYFSKMISPILNSIDNLPKMGLTDQQFTETKPVLISVYSSKITYIIIEFIKNIFLGLFLSTILSFIVSPKRNN